MFEITNTDKNARTGILKTKSGRYETPFFMPVATRATGKYLDSQDLKQLGVKTIIANAFILSLSPGVDVIERFGGIHKFMDFDGNIFTDSGGFQMYSERFLFGTSAEGIKFKNPFTGEIILCTPEMDMDFHLKINSDVAMCLDDMPMYPASKNRILESLKKTHEWARKCKEYHDKHNEKGQLLFGIAQGGLIPELRRLSAKVISSIGFDGLALGGLALGETDKEMYDAVIIGLKNMPTKKIKYLMGVGTPERILECVELGIDCFDSRYPTMTARHNQLFTRKGLFMIQKKEFAEDEKPIEEDCSCPICKNYSRAYINHLIKSQEANAKRLMSMHNLAFMERLITDIRLSIKENRFEEFKKEFLKDYLGR
jgi:queuine tRNA-ribosyltransferase